MRLKKCQSAGGSLFVYNGSARDQAPAFIYKRGAHGRGCLKFGC